MNKAITQLEEEPSEKFRIMQENISRHPAMIKRLLDILRNSSKAASDHDKSLVSNMMDDEIDRQALRYDNNMNDMLLRAWDNIMTGSHDSYLIYMSNNSGAGHVISITMKVGGLCIYDPNFGAINMRRHRSSKTLFNLVLGRILYFYECTEKYRFAIRQP